MRINNSNQLNIILSSNFLRCRIRAFLKTKFPKLIHKMGNSKFKSRIESTKQVIWRLDLQIRICVDSWLSLFRIHLSIVHLCTKNLWGFVGFVGFIEYFENWLDLWSLTKFTNQIFWMHWIQILGMWINQDWSVRHKPNLFKFELVIHKLVRIHRFARQIHRFRIPLDNSCNLNYFPFE